MLLALTATALAWEPGDCAVLVRHRGGEVRSIDLFACELEMETVAVFAAEWTAEHHAHGLGRYRLYLHEGWLDRDVTSSIGGPDEPWLVTPQIQHTRLIGELPRLVSLHVDDQGFVMAQEFVACHSVAHEATAAGLRNAQLTPEAVEYAEGLFRVRVIYFP